MSTITAAAAPGGLRGLWDRQLPHYPDTARRMSYLAITIVATITLYYALFIQGAVAPKIIAQYHFSFTEFVGIVAIGATFGAFASLAAGLADRWGRANLVVGGLLLTGLLVTFAMPNASGKAEYAVCYALVSIVEGVCLVATPALIRDFSPQVGRAAAMAFWTMGPVLGSLVVTEVSSHTLPSHPDWRYQFQLCGVVGLVVWVIALIGLRELSPRLRDQLMVSLRDRALVEARAAGIDPDSALKGHWRQMLRVNITGSALAISLFLVLFYVITAFAVVFLGTVFGYPASRANAVANWYWITAAITMLVIGFASDRVLVRKPFMVAGAVISLAGAALLAVATTHPHTGYYTFALSFVLLAAGFGLVFPVVDGRVHRDGGEAEPGRDGDRAGAVGLDGPDCHGGLVPAADGGGAGHQHAGGQGSARVGDRGDLPPADPGAADGRSRDARGAESRPGQQGRRRQGGRRDRRPVRDRPGAGGRAAGVAVGGPARGPGLPVGQRGHGRPGRQGQPGPVADLVVDLLRLPARVHPVRVLDGGHWNPRTARAEEQEHERMVQRELALLEAARTDPQTQARGAGQ